MFFLPLGVVSLLSAVGVFAYAQHEGGGDAAIKVSDHILTGTMLQVIALLLAIAGVLFIVSAVMKAVRRVAALLATAAILGGGGVGAFAPADLVQWELDHGCQHVSNVSASKACDQLRDRVGEK